MNEFPFKVGDRVRRQEWVADDFTTVTAIGRRQILGIAAKSEPEDEYVYSKAPPWQLYIEPVKQHRWETVTEWRAPKAGETYLEYGQSPLSVDAKYIVAFGDWASNLCRNVIVSCHEVTE